MEALMTLAKAVKALRKHLGISQQELATRAGLSIRAVAGYEAGTRHPEPASLVALAALAAEAGRQDLAHEFVVDLSEQLKLHRIKTGLVEYAKPGRPGLLLLAFADEDLNPFVQGFFRAMATYLLGDEKQRGEALRALNTFLLATELSP
jgi:transcriptional regulator with XRE-family HTH domain